ncbi:replication protein [Paenibacillus chitinolyticus]|uniref:replication protein n=1 Tax=Paenibacillus chitinolyticus TaxID=79263 RepID=UPI0035577E53
MITKHITEFIAPSEVHESLFVGYLWKTPTLYSKYKIHKIDKTTFTRPIWYFYYYVGKEMFESGLRSFEDTSVYSFLSSKPKEKGKADWLEVYNEFGAYSTIAELVEECDPEKGNEDYHLAEIQKYESLRKLQDEGFINVLNLELIHKLTSMSLSQLQTFYQTKFKSSFAQINAGEVVEYYLGDNLNETIEELKKGIQSGIPFFDSPRLNKKINGLKLGNLNYLVLPSGVGKSSILTEKAVLGIYESDEKAIVFANEEGIRRWRSRLLATVASRILKKPLARDIIERGTFTDEGEAILNEAREWIEKHRKENILFINLKKYRVQDVIGRIELYRARGYKHILFDTFKPDLSQQIERWLAFSNSAQDLYDCIKEEAYNCHCLATVQLKIGREYRFIDLDCIGKSLEIVEVAAVVMAGRLMFDDEYKEDGHKNRLYPYNWKKDDFSGEWIPIPYKLDPKKKYLILFLPKNREGSEDEQIVFEVNYDFNIWREVAYVKVPNNGR